MMLQYPQLIKKLFNTNLTGGVKLGLENCEKLNTILGMPAQAYPTIHVAGTNGKGSVVTKIAKALQLTGQKVGVYTSPHIACFRERITINGTLISEKDVELLLNTLFTITEKERIPATFFELTTLLAFKYFADQSVDIAVIETGLGGRLDATNIVTPKLCVITSIDLDHTEFLGETIEAITYEKAGIIKPKVPVVIGPSVSQEIIHAVADKLQSRVYQVSGTFETYDQENTELASTALNLLSIPPEIIQKGIQTLPHCRFEIFNKKKLSSLFKSIAVPEALILDVAHNPAGLRRLLNEVQLKFPEKPIIFLCGFSKNKDIRECLKLLKESGTYFYPAAAKNERAASPDFLKKQLLDLGVPKERIFTKESLKDSLEGSLNHAAINNGIVVISGTFFIMGEVREFLGIEEPKDLLNLN